jgi:hypothetical protein
MLAFGSVLVAGPLAPHSVAQAPDRSEVVIVLDFSASILQDDANRDRFAAALDRIADRIDATASDLLAGDTTVTIVQFATRAADYAGCTDLELLASPPSVARFAACLRDVAVAYRNGLDAVLTERIGVDTNYVAAMERAAGHLGADAVRPAVILFTDGKHDVQGVPIGQVQPARDRLFGNRSPFALLPVGMGLSPTERDALEDGLVDLRIIRDMPACITGARFDWPQVVFESADEAGNAVAIALQNVSCTFTVAPTAAPSTAPSPTPAPGPGLVRSLRLAAGDGRIEVFWSAPATPLAPVVDYRVRCRPDDGDWIESREGESLRTTAVVEGLTNGLEYECEVAASDATSEGPWKAASTTATPVGRPAPPEKPRVEALDHAVRIQVSPADPSLVSEYRYECSGDGGRTWQASVDVAATGVTATQVWNLANGVDYVCRAYAANAAGLSDPSAISDAVRPCGSLFECNPVMPRLVALAGFLALAGVLAALLALYREGRRGHVVAVVDVVLTANLGNRSKLGIRFERDKPHGEVTGIVADSGRKADLRIRHRRGNRFEVTDRVNRTIVASGEPLIVVDSVGVRHEIVLRGFRTAAASPVSRRG